MGVCAQDSKIDGVLHQLEQVHEFSGVTISPDGQFVTWLESPGDSSGSEIFLLRWKDGNAKPVRISAGNRTGAFEEHGVAWSADSTRLAFLSNAISSQEQIFVVPAAGGAAKQLTHVNGYVSDLRWSPDGKQLAFLYAENGGGGGPLEAEPAQTGVIEGQIHNQRIAVVNGDGGEVRQLSPANLNIYEYDWHPKEPKFAAIAARAPPITTGGLRNCTFWMQVPAKWRLIYRSSSGAADRGSTLVARWQAHRVHRRTHERRGL